MLLHSSAGPAEPTAAAVVGLELRNSTGAADDGEAESADLPEVSADRVILLEVTGLLSTPGLTQAQIRAVKGYDKAKSQYEEAAGAAEPDALAPSNESRFADAVTRVSEA